MGKLIRPRRTLGTAVLLIGTISACGGGSSGDRASERLTSRDLIDVYLQSLIDEPTMKIVDTSRDNASTAFVDLGARFEAILRATYRR
jgi:hypothetical protein